MSNVIFNEHQFINMVLIKKFLQKNLAYHTLVLLKFRNSSMLDEDYGRNTFSIRCLRVLFCLEDRIIKTKK